MAGDSGRSAENVVQETPESLKRLQGLDRRKSSADIASMLAKYGSGELALSDALSSLGSRPSQASQPSEARGRAMADLDKAKAELKAAEDAFNKGAKTDKGDLALALRQAQSKVANLDKAAGALSLQERVALGSAPDAGLDREALLSSIVQDPLAGAKLASEQVRGDSVLSRLFGDQGLMSRVDAEERDLASRGYQLQQEDREAYGQASGDIQRMYQQQEGELAKSLAARGLSAAPSGAATAGFSGLMGNKYEQLAKAQTAIADRRMQNTLQRLQSSRSLMSNLGGQYDTAVGNQTNRNLASIQDRRNERSGQTQLTQAQQQAQQNQLNTAFLQQEQTRTPSFGEVLGGVATGALGTLTGGLGTGIASGLGTVGAGLFGKTAANNFANQQGKK